MFERANYEEFFIYEIVRQSYRFQRLCTVFRHKIRPKNPNVTQRFHQGCNPWLHPLLRSAAPVIIGRCNGGKLGGHHLADADQHGRVVGIHIT